MTYLKYYADEAARYGKMGKTDLAYMEKAMEKAVHRFNIPRVKVKVSRTPRRRSYYRGGLNMVWMNLRLCRGLQVPTILVACNMLDWATFCHELAHTIHHTRFDSAVRAKLAAYKEANPDEPGLKDINPYSDSVYSRSKYRAWVAKNCKKERAHGAVHAKIMQEVVDFFVAEGYISTKPSYLTNSIVTSVTLNDIKVGLNFIYNEDLVAASSM